MSLEKPTTMTFKKTSRIKDEAYLDFVREYGCGVCLNSAEPHHLVSRGAGGSDYTAIPLCREHHTELHQYGKGLFEDKHHIDVWVLLSKVLAAFIQKTKEV